MEKQTIVIVGSGAIGRGFLPWKIDTQRYDLVFVDNNPELVKQLSARQGYLTFKIDKNGDLAEKPVGVKAALTTADLDLGSYGDLAAVFVAVGVDNVADIAECLKSAPETVPVVLCENNPASVDRLKQATGRERIYFAIPDVITSSTASVQNLMRDPLAVHSEDGILFVDEMSDRIFGDFVYLNRDELIGKQWTAKLYLHNTPHCIAAYLGALAGCNYLHEAMDLEGIRDVVTGAMEEMLAALKQLDSGNGAFWEWYAAKELKRFSDKNLYDPIARVAREPIRKLELGGRLLGAADMCQGCGIPYGNILVGIVCAAIYLCNGESPSPGPVALPAGGQIAEVFERVCMSDTKIHGTAMKSLPGILARLEGMLGAFRIPSMA